MSNRVWHIKAQKTDQLELLIKTLEQDIDFCNSYGRGKDDTEIGQQINNLKKFFTKKLKYARLLQRLKDKHNNNGGKNEQS